MQVKYIYYWIETSPKGLGFLCLSEALMELRFSSFDIGTSLLYFHKQSMTVFVPAYVNDIIVTNNQSTAISSLVTYLK
jgi:hypothetical protein